MEGVTKHYVIYEMTAKCDQGMSLTYLMALT